MKEQTDLRRSISLLIFGFIAAAFGGWLYEEACVYILYHHIYNRGMLHLTLCPIYGFGAWGLYALLHRVKHTALYFALSVLIASAFEWGCSYLLEALFHRSYWTYKDWPFSLDDRISLISSLMFGMLSVLFAKAVLPLLRRLMKKGRPAVWLLCGIAAVLVILGDFYIVAFRGA